MILYWKYIGDCQLNQCLIRIYWLNGAKVVVIASNITTFANRVIANITPEIICFVCNHCGIDLYRIMLVENYSLSNLKDADVYFHVIFVNNEAIRYDLSKDKLTRLIGKQI